MPLLGETVEASREKRIERQQARFRDRGGIFKPAEHNALLDILLSRGVNGESPSRANSPRRSRSRSASPIRKDQTTHPAPVVSKSKTSKKNSRKSEAKRLTQEAFSKDTAYTEVEGGPVAGPSKHTGRVKARKTQEGPTTKQTAPHTDSRGSSSKKAGEELGQSVPVSKSKKATKTTRTASSTDNDRAPKSKRAAVKRKAPEPEPEPDPEPDSHEPSDDEPLVPRKPDRTKAPTESRVKKPGGKKAKAFSKKRVAADHCEADGTPEPEKSARRATKKTKADPGEYAEQLQPDFDPPPTEAKRGSKGKHIVELPHDLNADDDSTQTAKVLEATTSHTVAQTQGRDEAGPRGKPTQPRKKRPARDNDDTRPSSTEEAREQNTTPHSPPPPPKHPGLAYEDVEPPRKRRKDVRNRPSSPEIPLARKSKSSKRAAEPNDHTIEQDAAEDVDDPPPEPPRKKRRPPEHEFPVVPAEPKADKRARGPPPPDTPMRKASRTKAPPVLAPKGTKLKPKPRPRLSMFPAPPSDGDDSDKDPIDFLS
ncbi:hypothetical protein C8Q78DRAFT_497237 [Trametes maxima]|nr:hypothetical protein C8Q78DRAFT_497237 [Trametes maxima]